MRKLRHRRSKWQVSAWDEPELVSPGPVVLSPGRMDSPADRRALKAGRENWQGRADGRWWRRQLGKWKGRDESKPPSLLAISTGHTMSPNVP